MEKTYINANMLYLLNLMHFLPSKSYTSRTDSAGKNAERETNENQSRRQKGIDGIKLIADGFSLKRSAKNAMPGMESEVKSNSK
jgi:hypothetical protein